MKILYVGPYNQLDGWGIACYHFIRSLEDKCDLSVRNIYLSGNRERRRLQDPFPHLQRIEHSYDAIIQQVLPNHFVYNKKCGINCGLPCIETIHDQDIWVTRSQLVDKILTFSEFEKYNAGWPHKDISVIGGALDLTQYNKRYNQLPDLKNKYNFYFIGENIERKRLRTLVKCYLQEFSYKDQVNLVIKSGTRQEIERMVDTTKAGLRKFMNHDMYPQVSHIDHYLSDEDMARLHQSCQCFVMPSCGESFCIPMAEALCHNNNVIINKNTGMSQFVNDDNAWLINARKSPVFCPDPPLHNLYTCREKWFEINEQELMRAMRQAYSGRSRKKGRQELIQQFSYKNVGERILECLH